jgi:hypothetical protein
MSAIIGNDEKRDVTAQEEQIADSREGKSKRL